MKRPKNFEPSKTDDIELPQTAQLIADVIGRDATLKLTKATKSRKIYVPLTMCAGHRVSRYGRPLKERLIRCTCKGHWIAKTIGDELAVLMSRTFGGETLDLAPCYYVHAFDRNTRIREQHRNGAHVLDLMREHGMSLRAIQYITAGFNGRQVKPTSKQRSPQRTQNQ